MITIITILLLLLLIAACCSVAWVAANWVAENAELTLRTEKSTVPDGNPETAQEEK